MPKDPRFTATDQAADEQQIGDRGERTDLRSRSHARRDGRDFDQFATDARSDHQNDAHEYKQHFARELTRSHHGHIRHRPHRDGRCEADG
jgi:hypothetical protein